MSVCVHVLMCVYLCICVSTGVNVCLLPYMCVYVYISSSDTQTHTAPLRFCIKTKGSLSVHTLLPLSLHAHKQRFAFGCVNA